jgi:hypothetical protein
MSNDHRNYAAARRQLIAYLHSQGYRAYPDEVFCPSGEHCWVDVAALKEQDYRAFEYKSRNDSIRRGFDQCCSYAKGFNYVVLVADRHRVTSSPYFHHFKAQGFGLWRHDRLGFHAILQPRRRNTIRNVKLVVERQFKHLCNLKETCGTPLSRWFDEPNQRQIERSDG